MTMGQGLSDNQVLSVPIWLHLPVQAATLAVTVGRFRIRTMSMGGVHFVGRPLAVEVRHVVHVKSLRRLNDFGTNKLQVFAIKSNVFASLGVEGQLNTGKENLHHECARAW